MVSYLFNLVRRGGKEGDIGFQELQRDNIFGQTITDVYLLLLQLDGDLSLHFCGWKNGNFCLE